MKAIHLTAGFALFLLPLTTASAATSTFQAASIATAPGGGSKVPGDFNGDGNSDLLFQNSTTGNLRVWLMNRTKPFENAPVPDGGDANQVAVGTHDFDGDNQTDVLTWDPRSGELTIWYMDGTQLLHKSTLPFRIDDYSPVSILDFNRDGSPDILFQSQKGNDILVALMQGETLIAKQPIVFSAELSTSWRVVGSGDFDRDGDYDFVVVHSGLTGSRDTADDTLAVLLMDGTTGRIKVITQLFDRNWQIRAVADFTADGSPDFIWEHFPTGSVGVWEMQGLKIGPQYVLTGTSSLNRGWHVVGPR